MTKHGQNHCQYYGHKGSRVITSTLQLRQINTQRFMGLLCRRNDLTQSLILSSSYLAQYKALTNMRYVQEEGPYQFRIHDFLDGVAKP